MQPKLSARLNLHEQGLDLVDRHGQFILKPQNPHFKNLQENEDVTMRLAKTVGLEISDHGLIYAKDGQLTYWIRRFDRGLERAQPAKLFVLKAILSNSL